MFKLVGMQDSLYAILDTDDDSIDILPRNKVSKCLNLGISIGGITKVSDDSFTCSDEYFPKSDEGWKDDEDEDDYDDYEDEELEEEGDEEEYADYEYEDPYDTNDKEEEEQDTSTVSKLYTHLNEEQIKLLKRYYLWYSQRIFDEGRQKARTLQVTNNPRKLQKQKELNAMRNQGGMWAYAGFIDMGYRGADYCTLGHPLRYVHLAWDISVSDIETSFFGEEFNKDIEEVINSSNCIKFGIDCISDFFEIDKEYTDRLKRAQREAIKDMDFMCQYYENGYANEVIASFTVTDEIVNKVSKIDAKGFLISGDNYKCLIPRSLSSFYLQFRKLNMVVPKSLIQEIRDNLVGWGSHKFIGWKYPDWNVLLNIVKTVLGKSSESFVNKLGSYSYGYEAIINDYLIEFFQLKSCGYYEYNAETFKDEGGASKPVKSQLYAIHNDVKKNFWSDREYTFSYLKKLLELDNELSRIKDIIEAFDTPTEAYRNNECRYYIDDKTMQLDFSTLKHYDEERCNGFYEWFENLRALKRSTSRICKIDYNKCKSLDEFLTSLKDTIQKVLAEADDYQAYALTKLQESVNAKNKVIDDERKEREERERQEELELQKKEQEEAERKEKASKLSDEEIRQYCFDNAKKVKGNSKLKFALTVLDTIKKTGKCSDKQMYYVNQIYTELTGVQLEDKRKVNKVNLDDRKDIEDAIDTVLADPDLLEDEDDKEKVYAILTSIKKYRSISERQMKYAEIALKVVKED